MMRMLWTTRQVKPQVSGKIGAQIKTAPEPPEVPLLAQRVAFEGLAELVRSSTDG